MSERLLGTHALLGVKDQHGLQEVDGCSMLDIRRNR